MAATELFAACLLATTVRIPPLGWDYTWMLVWSIEVDNLRGKLTFDESPELVLNASQW